MYEAIIFRKATVQGVSLFNDGHNILRVLSFFFVLIIMLINI